MEILCIINNGFEETETICPIDILKRAGHNVLIASNTKEVIGAHGIVFKNIDLLENIDCNKFQLLLLPGGAHYINNEKDELYLNTILKFKTKIIAAICASPTILGKLNLLENKKYTCFPPLNSNFKGTFTSNITEVDGNIITARGAGASLEFGFKILEVIDGLDKANEIKKSMYY